MIFNKSETGKIVAVKKISTIYPSSTCKMTHYHIFISHCATSLLLQTILPLMVVMLKIL